MRLLAKVAALAAELDDTLRCQNRPRHSQPPSQVRGSAFQTLMQSLIFS
jgi:hypothetical protein